MAKIIDITDKLSFDKNPAIRIDGREITVNDDAPTVLKLMGKLGDGEKDITPATMAEITDLLFTPEGRKVLDDMHLTFRDFSVVVETAMNMLVGEEESDPKQAVNNSMISSVTGI